jgi:hypothetical protein
MGARDRQPVRRSSASSSRPLRLYGTGERCRGAAPVRAESVEVAEPVPQGVGTAKTTVDGSCVNLRDLSS